MNYKMHLIVGIIASAILVFLLNKTLPHELTIINIAIIVPITIIASLLPDIDTTSRIRKITDMVFIIGAVILIILGLSSGRMVFYYISAFCGIIFVSSRIVTHRGIYHRWWFHSLLSIGIGYVMHYWIYGLAYFIGFAAHKLLDYKFTKVIK